MKKIKKSISLVLALIFSATVFTAVPFSVSAEDSDGLEKSGEAGSDCTWVFSDNGTLTISGYGDMYGYHSGWEYAPWWYLHSKITSINLSNGLTSIGRGAFVDCENITNIDIPITVTSIGENAFEGCSSLEMVVIPDAVTEIDIGAFSNCTNLKTLKIGSGVQYIGGYAFQNCGSLSSITVSKNNETYDSRNNCNAVISTEFNELVVGSLNTVIPNSVAEIRYEAFSGFTDLKSVTIPSSVESIGANAFGYYYDEEWNKLKVEGFTIYGVKGSEAERYANENDFKFIGINPPAPQVTIGDVNGDENVDVLDAAMVQKHATGKADLTDVQLVAADVNSDGNVDVLDAAEIQKYAAGIITEFKKKS